MQPEHVLQFQESLPDHAEIPEQYTTEWVFQIENVAGHRI